MSEESEILKHIKESFEKALGAENKPDDSYVLRRAMCLLLNDNNVVITDGVVFIKGKRVGTCEIKERKISFSPDAPVEFIEIAARIKVDIP